MFPQRLFRPVMSWIRAVHTAPSQKRYRARVNTLLLGADQLLLTPRADTLETYFANRLADPAFHNVYRPTAWARLVRFCLARHLYGPALALYERMRAEGFFATRALAVRMAALRTTDTHALGTLLEDPAYDVAACLDLVRFLVDEHQPVSVVEDLARTFASAHRLALDEHPEFVGELVQVNVRAGRVDAAQAWLRDFEDACEKRGVLPHVAPYSNVISALQDVRPDDGDAFQGVLERMRSVGVSPDTNVFNTLMRAHLVQKRYQEAFALYRVLMSSELMPSDVTYKMLFRATLLLNHPRHARRHKHLSNAIAPRALFREMLACHLEQTHGRASTPSTVVSVSAFHLVLRTFLACQDYAAAAIVVRALYAFGFQPNLQTYLIVFVSLLGRMKRESNLVRPPDAYRLVDFLTHVYPDEDPDLADLVDRIQKQQPAFRVGASVAGVDTVAHLLALGEPTRTDDDLADGSLPRFPKARRSDVPTIAMLTSVEGLATSNASYSPLPLVRILHKTLLGELFRKAVHRPGWDWKGATVPIMAETAREMVPEGVGDGTVRTKEVLPFAAARMRRRRRSARAGREVAFDFETQRPS